MPLLDRRTRRGLLLAIPASAILGFLEGVGFGLIFPLIQVLAAPESLKSKGGMLSRAYEWSGLRSSTEFLVLVGSLIFGLLLLKSLLAILYLRWQTKLLSKGEADVAIRLFRQYLFAEYSFHIGRHSSELIRNVQTLVSRMFGQMLLPLVQLLAETFLILAIVVTLIIVDPVAATASLGTLGITALAYLRIFGRRTRGLGAEDVAIQRETQHQIQEALGGVKTLHALGCLEPVAKQYGVTRRELARVRQKQLFLNQLPRYLLETALIVALVIIVLVILVSRTGAHAVASLGLLAAGSFRLMPSLGRVLTASNSATAARTSAEVVVAEFGMFPPVDQIGRDDVKPLSFERDLRLENLSFVYPGSNEPVLREIDLVLARGESVGLVGSSGAGKTTLVDLILGLLRPTSGRLLVDGEPIEGDRLMAWRRTVGYVPQDVFLFDDTIRHNIAVGLDDDEIDGEQVDRAIELAQLMDLMAELPDGLETSLGERGVRLSGGQRQRIGIARALYGRPKMLVLDEATSALDGVTEAAITATVEALHGQLTMLVIAHRLTTVRRCDRIVLLSAGTVAGAGAFDDLAQSSEHFGALVRVAGLMPDDSP